MNDKQPELEFLVDLASAHATQLTNADQSKSPWLIRQNKTSKDLHKLRSTFKEDEVFEILDFARKFELIALNAGINFQKKISAKHYKRIIDGMKEVMEALTADNDRLSAKLQQLIGE